jgi:hypothetical protein
MLPAGTYKHAEDGKPKNTQPPRVGGVVFRLVIEVNPVHPENAPRPIVVTLLPMITEVNPMQPENAPSSIVVTLLGIVIEVKPVQPKNAALPIVVTLLGITIEVNPVQPLNAKFPIVVTLLPIVTEVNPVQFSNAELPIAVTLLPIVRCLIAVPNGRETSDTFLPIYTVSGDQPTPRNVKSFVPSSTIIVFRFVQSLNAQFPIVVMLLGIVIEVNPMQYLNA